MELKKIVIAFAMSVFSLTNVAQAQTPTKTYKVGEIVSSIPLQAKKQSIVTFLSAELKKSDGQGWEAVEDLHARNTTTLYFQLKRDRNSVMIGIDKKRYVKTAIRFGFKDDANGYQLPGSYYVQEFQSEIMGHGEEGLSYLNPCIMYKDGEFYIFVPSLIGQDLLESSIFIYSAAKGLSKQTLWTGSIKKSYLMPYFKEDAKQQFALWQNFIVSEKYGMYDCNVLSTKIENNKWVTRIEQVAISLGSLKDTFNEQIQPYFFPLEPVPFKKVTIADKWYAPYNDLAVFLNTPKDKALYGRLSTLPKHEDDFKLARKDRNKFQTVFNSSKHPVTFYNEIAHTSIVVPNMPATKDQAPFGTCVSYAYGALYAQWINSDWQLRAMRKIEPNALKKETDISYFGMQQYFRGNSVGVHPNNLWKYPLQMQKELIQEQANKEPEFDFEFKEGGFFFPFEIILQNENRLDSIPYFVEEYYFKKYGTIYPKIGEKNEEIGDIFRSYLERLYQRNHPNVKANKHYQLEVAELSAITGIPIKNLDLQQAFAKSSFRAFMYEIFFGKCLDFVTVAYRESLEIKQIPDQMMMKQNIVKILQQGKPVLISIYNYPNFDREDVGHALVIDGYKKLIDPNTGQIIDAFKLHNSMGKVWDEQTNGGWFLADHILSHLRSQYIKYTTDGKALSRDWIEDTDDYQRIYKGEYSQEVLKTKINYIGSSTSNKQIDATSLLQTMKNNKLSFREYADFMKTFFKKLGYKFLLENEKDQEIEFEGISIWSGSVAKRRIICPTKQLLNQLKMKLDFSKINGEFVESAFAKNGGNYLRVRQTYD